MTQAEYKYRDTVNLIACALLLFSGAFFAFGWLISFLGLWTRTLAAPWGELIYQSIYALLYAAVFLFPVWFFLRVRCRACPPCEMALKPKMQGDVWAYLFAGLALIHLAAWLNAVLMETVGVSSNTVETMVHEAQSNGGLVLQFLVMAVVPPFVEELLFRGVVLGNLLPFGKWQAILGSAVLFGLMHQSVEQLLYATVGGLVLGYIYVATRSIWPCILLHLVNNGTSVLQAAFYARLSAETATAISTVLQSGIYCMGLIGGAYLLLRKHPARSTDVTPVESDGETLTAGRRLRLFLSPAMLTFIAVTLVQTVIRLWIALLA